MPPMPKKSSPSLGDLLMSLRQKISEHEKVDLLKHELTYAQLEVLRFLDSAKDDQEHGGRRSMENIATHLHIKPPSVTSLIDRMEKNGLVTREKDPTDRRIVNISMTSKTRTQFTLLKQQREAVFIKLTSKLSVKDKREFERILLHLIEN